MVEEGERVAIFNNVTNKVRDDLIKTIREGSQVSVAAACFFHVSFLLPNKLSKYADMTHNIGKIRHRRYMKKVSAI